MGRTARRSHSPGRGAMGLGLLVLMAGCANLFGIDDWEDPPLPSTSGETSASSSSGGGGIGGIGGAGGAGGTTTVHVSTGASNCDVGQGGAGQGGAGQDPTCGDCIKNGPETDVDCGGDSCGPCPLGAACLNDADCDSGSCPTGVCEPPPPPCNGGQGGGSHENPTCGDCVANGLETDVDCGGDACPPCLGGRLCLTAADCASGVCLQSGCE